MKLQCNREALLAAFNVVANVVPSRSPKPVLMNVKLDAVDQQVWLTGTDLEVAMRISVPDVEVEVPGSVLLPVGRFGLILRESNDQKLRLHVEANGTIVRGDRSEFKLAGGNPDEFPPVPSFEESRYQELSARLFKELIRRTVFATDTENSRYALGGVLLEFEQQKITAVGTDGRRLARMEGPSSSVGDHHLAEAMTIVPTRSMQLIDRALTDGDAEIRVATRGNDILVQTARATIFSRLVEGRFPRWRDVFPQRREAVSIQLPAGRLYSALRQAAVVASEDSRGVDFQFAGGSLILSASTAEIGQARVEMPIDYSGSPQQISLDHRYVSDFLRVLDSEKIVTFEMEGPEAAALLSTDDGYGYVIMPMAREH
ncbi:MAG: polymerase subunit beta [Planctomycetota bacterium]